MNYLIQKLRVHVAGLAGYQLQFDEEKLAETVEDLSEYHFHFHGLGYKKDLREVYVQEEDKPSRLPPVVHSSVSGLQNNHDVYSVVRKKRRLLRQNKAALAHIIYNPINLKLLRNKRNSYTEVATVGLAQELPRTGVADDRTDLRRRRPDDTPRSDA